MKKGTTWVLALSAMAAASVLAQPQGRREVVLPAGEGKAEVQALCSGCHSLEVITASGGYTREGWKDLIASMIALPPRQSATVSRYLAEHFPVKPRPAAVKIPGASQVRIREWLVPTLGSRPHDPLVVPDGSIWWTGQWANRLGRLDPGTGRMKEFPLATAESGPHGLIADRHGNIWFTAISKNYIGRLDPRTGEVAEFPITAPNARGPHTPIFDADGRLWFTMQSGMVGRLDPESGEMKVATTPSSRSYPYGIVVNARGVPWYVDFRGNRVGRVDPETMTIREYTLPDTSSRPRRIALTSDDAVWYTDHARGRLGRFDPRDGSVREWRSPGGDDSRPYGIAAVGRIVWYSESGVRPNTLVRFDPAREKFQTWIIPSGGGIVRHMMATPQGDLVLACSGVNRVALVDVVGR
jgi:virginiamycin B lyase